MVVLLIYPNYNSEATIDDFSCDISSTDIYGCTDINYIEYIPNSTIDNGTCQYGKATDPTADNYNVNAIQMMEAVSIMVV